MIVVVGRPGLTGDEQLDRLAGHIALEVARNGGRVELVGSVGDDADGDTVVVQLGRAGIGHAAILRDPAGVTPRDGDGAGGGDGASGGDARDADALRRLPRLDAGDIDLGLRYLPECRVLVVAEPLADDALGVVADAAGYHGAALVVLAAGESTGPVPDSATVLEIPPERGPAFAELVARYALELDSGSPAADAWRIAIDQTGWEHVGE